MMCSMLLMKSAERSGQEIVEPIDKEIKPFQLIIKKINELIHQDELIVPCDQRNRNSFLLERNTVITRIYITCTGKRNLHSCQKTFSKFRKYSSINK